HPPPRRTMVRRPHTRTTRHPPPGSHKTMTSLFTTVEHEPNGNIRRDQYGRYILPDPVTGEEKPWTRVTTLAGTLADRRGLEKWAQRNIVYGLGQRQDLYRSEERRVGKGCRARGGGYGEN